MSCILGNYNRQKYIIYKYYTYILSIVYIKKWKSSIYSSKICSIGPQKNNEIIYIVLSIDKKNLSR